MHTLEAKRLPLHNEARECFQRWRNQMSSELAVGVGPKPFRGNSNFHGATSCPVVQTWPLRGLTRVKILSRNASRLSACEEPLFSGHPSVDQRTHPSVNVSSSTCSRTLVLCHILRSSSEIRNCTSITGSRHQILLQTFGARASQDTTSRWVESCTGASSHPAWQASIGRPTIPPTNSAPGLAGGQAATRKR